MRRFLELQEKGMLDRTFEALLEEIKERDWNDSHRAHSPLIQAEGAIRVDTTGLALEEATERVMEIIEKARMG